MCIWCTEILHILHPRESHLNKKHDFLRKFAMVHITTVKKSYWSLWTQENNPTDLTFALPNKNGTENYVSATNFIQEYV